MKQYYKKQNNSVKFYAKKAEDNINVSLLEKIGLLFIIFVIFYKVTIISSNYMISYAMTKVPSLYQEQYLNQFGYSKENKEGFVFVEDYPFWKKGKK